MIQFCYLIDSVTWKLEKSTSSSPSSSSAAEATLFLDLPLMESRLPPRPPLPPLAALEARKKVLSFEKRKKVVLLLVTKVSITVLKNKC